MKLQQLKPRLQAQKKPTAATKTTSTSWRDGKSSTQRGYGYKWQKYRANFLHSNPLCVFCMRLGVITAATVVDHKVPHKGDQNLFWNSLNHQALCKKCHDSTKQKIENSQKLVGGSDF